MMGSAPARTRRLVALAIGLALSASAVLASMDRVSPGEIALDLSVGWLFIACGELVWSRGRADRVGLLMIATGLAWLVGGVFHRGPLVHLLLAFPTGRLRTRLATGVVVFAYVDGVIGSFVALDPVTIVLAAGLLLAAGESIMGSTGPVRRGRSAASVAAVAVAMILVAWPLAAALRVDARVAQELIYAAVLAVTAVGITADLVWGGWSRAAVTGLVVELGGRAEAGTLRERLARALGDSSLVVGYPIGDSGGYVDDAGRAISLPPPGSGRVITPIGPAGAPATVLIHDPAVLGDPDLVMAVSAATRVAIANVQLQVDIQARVADLEASQRRIVEASDVQRRRLERELSAGVIARMSHVGELLGAVRPGIGPSAAAEVAPAIGELGVAEEELRRFARGVFPPTLTEDGLAVAVAELASRSSVPVVVRMAVDRLPATVEATAYFVCSEALANVAKHAQATRAEIRGAVTGGRLDVVISDDGIGGADLSGSGIRGLEARVEAMGGRLDVVSPPGQGTRLKVVLPVR